MAQACDRAGEIENVLEIALSRLINTDGTNPAGDQGAPSVSDKVDLLNDRLCRIMNQVNRLNNFV